MIAVDIDPVKVACARRNAEIYQVEDRIEFIVGDFFHVMPHLKVSITPFHVDTHAYMCTYTCTHLHVDVHACNACTGTCRNSLLCLMILYVVFALSCMYLLPQASGEVCGE